MEKWKNPTWSWKGQTCKIQQGKLLLAVATLNLPPLSKKCLTVLLSIWDRYLGTADLRSWEGRTIKRGKEQVREESQATLNIGEARPNLLSCKRHSAPENTRACREHCCVYHCMLSAYNAVFESCMMIAKTCMMTTHASRHPLPTHSHGLEPSRSCRDAQLHKAQGLGVELCKACLAACLHSLFAQHTVV
eukprot:1160210-Pelagomonas_calceolata.AAC.9